MLVNQMVPGDFTTECGEIVVEITDQLITSATLNFDDSGSYSSTKLTIDPSSAAATVNTHERTITWTFTGEPFHDISLKD